MARPKPCAPPVTTAQRLLRSILFMVKSLSMNYPSLVSRTRCSVLHGAPQSRDRTKRRCSLRPRLCSAPLREELRAALRPGHGISQRPAAVDDMRDAGGEGAFIAGEIPRERADLIRGAEPAHRLAADE